MTVIKQFNHDSWIWIGRGNGSSIFVIREVNPPHGLLKAYPWPPHPTVEVISGEVGQHHVLQKVCLTGPRDEPED